MELIFMSWLSKKFICRYNDRAKLKGKGDDLENESK